MDGRTQVKVAAYPALAAVGVVIALVPGCSEKMTSEKYLNEQKVHPIIDAFAYREAHREPHRKFVLDWVEAVEASRKPSMDATLAIIEEKARRDKTRWGESEKTHRGG